jgi:Major Facilitator Superfamily
VDFWWSLKSASTAIWVAPSGRLPTQFVLQAESSRLPLREASGRPALNYQPRLPEAAPAAFFVRHVSYPRLVVGSACGFMGQLDASIVQLGMPSLETAFDASLNAVSWVAVGYMLAVACALPIFSRLAEIAGRKSIFLSGFASFAVLSTCVPRARLSISPANSFAQAHPLSDV